MDTWRGRRKPPPAAFLDPVHVGGDTNKTMDRAEGLPRTLSMHAREAVERQRKTFPTVSKKCSDTER